MKDSLHQEPSEDERLIQRELEAAEISLEKDALALKIKYAAAGG